ncbi:Rrf2 family transcriptional regulator [Halothiobacillus sp.]|uniref:RrF2 family transcriptional regulator n=1 Tax=Halothiobacillus sp. TaxID=1891311 RepID=UPI002AD26140|nr:Rrf2 family transcriptional regulator [Halothiobacillus sp.]
MQLNQQTDYALRILMLLAKEERAAQKTHTPTPRLVTIREIAEFHGISKNHLMKIVNKLAEHGIVHAQRGHKGGLRLEESGLNMRVGDIVRLMEGGWQMAACFSIDGKCPIQSSCQLQQALYRALNAFWTELDQYTLGDMIEPKSKPEAVLIQKIRHINEAARTFNAI